MSGAAFADVPVSTYLALETSGADAPARHEYWDGQVRAMTGASLAHNRANIALGSLLWHRLRGGPCEAFANDMRVRLSPTRYVYPDIVVACPPEVDATHRPESLLNPKVIFEVLSPSSCRWSRC